MAERLQKLIAQAGLASRREAEKWIEQGNVILNGHPAKLGRSSRFDCGSNPGQWERFDHR